MTGKPHGFPHQSRENPAVSRKELLTHLENSPCSSNPPLPKLEDPRTSKTFKNHEFPPMFPLSKVNRGNPCLMLGSSVVGCLSHQHLPQGDQAPSGSSALSTQTSRWKSSWKRKHGDISQCKIKEHTGLIWIQ